MKQITIKETQRLIPINPFGLVVTCDTSGKQNLMALSWWTFASNTPPALAVCLSRHGYSQELITQTKEFSLCLVDESLKKAAFSCGTCSGRQVDKALEFSVELVGADHISPKLVKESRIAFECRARQTVVAGDHMIFVADVVAIHADETKKQLYAVNGYGALKAF